MKLPEWLSTCFLYKKDVLSDDSEREGAWEDVEEYERVDSLDEATVISSKFVEGCFDLHKVFIDLDVEHYYVPSSTPGHGHLYINTSVNGEELYQLQSMLAELGIVGWGWANQVKGRGQNTFRLPGITKEKSI